MHSRQVCIVPPIPNIYKVTEAILVTDTIQFVFV